MDANQALLWFVAFSAIATLVRFTQRNVPRMPGYLLVAVVTLATCGVGWFLVPASVGYIAAGLWLVLFMAPVLVSRRFLVLTLRQDFVGARRWGRLLVLLHPADGIPAQRRSVTATEAATRGDVARAVFLFEGLRADDPGRARWYEAQMLRLQCRWSEINALELSDADLRSSPMLIPLRVRAAGETGGLVAATTEYDRFRSRLEGRMLIAAADATRLYLFAFAGKREAVDSLIRSSPFLRLQPDANRRFWLATADLHAGREERAREELQGLLGAADVVLRTDAADRLTPAGIVHDAKTPATDAARASVAHAASELADEQRFGVRPAERRVVPVATFGLLAVMLATYLFYELRDGASLQAALEAGGMWPPLVAAGDWWRLFTSTWLHASWTHLLMNAFGLLVLGPFVERSLGVPRYLAVYLLAAVGGNVALFAFMQAGVVPMHPVVGASGGIMGIFGAWAAVLLLGWRERRARVALRRLVVLSAILVLQILFDVTTPQVSFAAHALGLVIGLATTLIAGRGRS